MMRQNICEAKKKGKPSTLLTQISSTVDRLSLLLINGTQVGPFVQQQLHHLHKELKRKKNSQQWCRTFTTQHFTTKFKKAMIYKSHKHMLYSQ